MRKKLIVAGGSGFIGSRLIPVLDRAGYEVIRLSRRPGADTLQWDGKTVGPWGKALKDAYGVINLTGATISQRWTEAAKAEIINSRLDAVKAIGLAKADAGGEPFHWINASAVGFYGDPGMTRVDETSPVGTGFLAETCQRWEAATMEFGQGHLVSRFRIGFVLGMEGGGLPVLARLARLGLGGSVGTGQQGISWIDRNDLVRMMQWCLELEQPPELLNAVGKNPCSNGDFMRSLRKVVGSPLGIPAPAFAVKLASNVLGTAPELALSGSYVIPKVALDLGFQFESEDLTSTLTRLLP